MDLAVTTEDREAATARLFASPAGQLDPAAPLLTAQGYCPVCSGPVIGFRDELSKTEYGISGLCQSCQDSTFGADGDSMETPIDPEQLNELQEPHWNELD
jgi:hypothetical protein